MKIIESDIFFKEPPEYSGIDSDLNLQKRWLQEQLIACGRQEPLRILIGSNTLACGGAEHQIMRLMPHLLRLGLEVEHMYYGTPHFLKRQFEEKGLTSHFLDRDVIGQLLYWQKAVSLMRRRRYDIVHAFGQTANFYVRGAAALAGVPVLIAGWRNRVMETNLKWRLPISFLNLMTRAWIVNSKSNVEALGCLWGLGKTRVYILNNALDFVGQDFTEAAPLNQDINNWINGRRIVGGVGRVASQKNFDLFIDVAKLVYKKQSNVCFCIVGAAVDSDQVSIELERHLKARIVRESLSGFVKMLGRFDNVAGFLPHLSLLLCTSDYEGCPNVVMEGMRACLPVVMTDCCDTTWLIEQGKNGYVVPLNDVHELAEKTCEILNSMGNDSFGLHSRFLVESRFRAEVAAWRLAQIYIREWQRKGKRMK